MSEHSIDSLCEFLLHAGTDFRIYDIGRGVYQVPSQTFLQLENGEFPVPNPRQGHAWYALVFWQASHAQALTSARQYIWFLKLAVDEQSKIINATRTHFLRLIVDALQKDPELENGLQDNPYVFTPSETVRAQLTAKVKADLNLINQDDIANVMSYINAPGAIDWRNISQQNVHDACYKIVKDDNISKHIQINWQQLAEPFTTTLLAGLEPTELSQQLEAFLIDLVNKSENEQEKVRALQALCSEQTRISITAMLAMLLSVPKSMTLDLLSVIAGRFANQFSPAIVSLFFQRSSEVDEAHQANGEIVKGFFEDLVRIPSIREDVLRLLRQ